MANSRICSIPDCGKRAVNFRGWCGKHYQRWYNHGDPLFRKCAANGEVEKYFNEVVMTYDGDECLFWPYARITNGYPTIGGGGTTHYAHRRVCTETHGPAPTPNHEAAHSCGNGHLACVAKRHLSWKTTVDNSADRIRHGTYQRGETVNGAKLTECQVLAIYALRGVEFQRETAARYQITRQTVSDIQRKRRWGWLLPHETADSTESGHGV